MIINQWFIHHIITLTKKLNTILSALVTNRRHGQNRKDGRRIVYANNKRQTQKKQRNQGTLVVTIVWHHVQAGTSIWKRLPRHDKET